MEKLIKPFSEISAGDVAETGGKNSSLGEMFTQLSSKGIKVPDGFAATAFAFKSFLAPSNPGERSFIKVALKDPHFSPALLYIYTLIMKTYA